MIGCVLTLLLGQLLSDPTIGPSTELRDLYQRAALAIDARELPLASELLEQLIGEHADSQYAPLAAYHLAEVHWFQQRPQLALETLAQWHSRIEDVAASANGPAPHLGRAAHQLLLTILTSLPESSDTLEVLEELITRTEQVRPCSPLTVASTTSGQELSTAEASPKSTADSLADGASSCSPPSPMFHASVYHELFNRHLSLQQYQQAQLWLEKAVASTPRTEWELELQFELPVAWAEHELSSGHPAKAIELLTQATQLPLAPEHELAVRFLLAESLFAAGKHNAAINQFDWLDSYAHQLSPPPTWLAAVALRRGELLVRTRDYAAAQQWLLSAKQDYADFDRAYEFDYLLARCAVAQIEFDEAKLLFQKVIEAPSAQGTEAESRAAWMMGEVSFLQRDYAEAIGSYQRVAQMDAFPQWQARALLQSAKCYEHLGQPQRALTDYRRAQQLNTQDDIQRQATERVGAIESLSPKLR